MHVHLCAKECIMNQNDQDKCATVILTHLQGIYFHKVTLNTSRSDLSCQKKLTLMTSLHPVILS